MFQKERMEKILSILKCHGYVTVKYLTEELHYSTATVNRDLNVLQQMKEIKRTYGGVELNTQPTVPVMFRYEQCKPEKKRIAKRAAELVEDGDTLFMDGSTTVQYMGEYLLEKKNITVLTNNTALSAFLAEYGIDVIVLGGRVMEPPYMLAGNETVEAASHYKADKCFFSTAFVSRGGEMAYTGDIYFSMHRTMMRNSKKVFYLADAGKLDRSGGKMVLGDFSLVDCVISDHRFEDDAGKQFPAVEYICVGEDS
ncbi:MAG: DeoR/GlpR transcriptional regulator [Clostridia bacterium]|nr:DeoR/GlpR transcriptional regulator [Clostridia bacterium]